MSTLNTENRTATGETRLVEIETRQAQIVEESRTAEGEALAGLLEEMEALNGEYDTIEKRQKLLEDVRTGRKGTPIEKPKPAIHIENRNYSAEDDVYRDAWAKDLLCMPLSETERRALSEVNHIEYRELGFALTSTSETFQAPTASVDGVNNGGLFIPKYVSDRLLEVMALGSPILEDIGKMDARGMISFPYEKQSDPAKWREEGVCNDLESIEWADLKVYPKELSKTVRVSWKLEALTPMSFINYLLAELRRKMQRERAIGVIYGSGGLEPDGLRSASYKVTYTSADNLIDKAITEGERIRSEYFTGAKLYLSRSASNRLAMTKNSNGDYILPPINGNGISSIASIPIAVDPYLKDGDALLGNITNGAILNTSEPLSITKDISGRCRINDYTAYEVLGTVVFPEYTIFFELDDEDMGA